MDFRQLLLLAQEGDEFAAEKILSLYRPLMVKESMIGQYFDEDLYQELCITLIQCIRKFKIILATD